VVGVRYHRFGDFAGFTLRLEDGCERSFRSHERRVEELVPRRLSPGRGAI